ncbi:MAG TPA: lysylphosphatidylglycerol synthase transmembrane domain-containing protein [Candidatus Limnocylindrales bacterium]
MNRSLGTLARAGLGIAVSVVALYLVLRSVDLARAWEVLRSAAPGWIAVMLLLVLLDVSARGLRWQWLLRPIAHVPYRRVLGYTFMGYLANNVLPARLGELVRSHALGQGEGLSRTTVLGTVVVERVIDTAIVVGIAAVSILVLSVRGVLASAVLLGFAFVGLLVVALAVGVAAHRLPGMRRITAFAERWPRVVELARRLREGLSVAGRPSTVAGAAAIGLVAWSASIGTFLVGGQALGIELSLSQAALLSSGVSLATIVPSGPGYLGTFELTAASIAGLFGVGSDAGFALAVLVHAAIVVVTSVGGLVAFLRLRGRTGDAPSGTRNEGPSTDGPS